jgi:hypothetical protein
MLRLIFAPSDADASTRCESPASGLASGFSVISARPLRNRPGYAQWSGREQLTGNTIIMQLEIRLQQACTRLHFA